MNIEATFCFVDLAGFSALTEAHGDDAALNLLDRFTELVETSRGDADRLIKTIGDAALVTSGSPETAVEFIARLWGSVAVEPDFPEIRAGLHHGQAVAKRNDVFGAAVNLAARVASQAAGGEVVATALIARAAECLGFATTSLGVVPLRNIRDPVELYALELTACSSAEMLDPVCRMRVHPQHAVGRLTYEGTSYFFCSLRCSSLFASNPEAYAGNTQG